MEGYGWDKYDPRHGGIQTIHDAANRLDITTTFVKVPEAGDKGGHWAVRIKGTLRKDADPDMKSTVVFAVAAEGQGLTRLEVVGDESSLKNEAGIKGDIVIEGENPSLGPFRITVKEGKNNHPTHAHASAEGRPLENTFVHSTTLPDNLLWQTRSILFNRLKESIDEYVEAYGQEDLPPPAQFYTMKTDAGYGNHHLIQRVFEGAFEFDILFSSAAADKEMTSEELTERTKSIVKSFDEKYAKVMKPQAPFDSDKYLEFSKSLFSNLMGGIGYFRGDWRVDRSNAPEYDEENEGFWEETEEARSKTVPATEGPSELFTSIPSRPFFPRGFLWDEGFHLLPIMDWDVDLTMEIVKSWFSLIDDDGWIAREQILGSEARSKVPEEFQVQYPHYANPPTLFFILTEYINRLSNPKISASPEDNSLMLNKEAAIRYLTDLYPLLKRHYEWFRRTQQGDIKTYDREPFSSREGYRWRGRTPTHLLTSGLDDYPRAQPPHPGELHVDALSWVGLMTKSLKQIAQFLGENEDASTFSKREEAIVKNLDDLHWDDRSNIYCDATIDPYEEDVHVCHKGYISLFPLLTGMMEKDNPHIGKLLDVISDPEQLWSDYGIRSLSKQDELYATAENYWRSPIWININYLIVARLLELAQSKGPNQTRAVKIYTDLRKNLVETVFNSWKETGFAWEQYNPETGAGQRTQHFTGWTSLVVKILAMPDLSKGASRDEL